MGRLRAGFGRDFRGPSVSPPVEAFGGRLVGHALPPHAAVRGERHVGENGVLAQGRHGVRVGFVAGSWSDAKEAGLGVDGVEASIGVRLDPGDVVAHGPDFPPLPRVVLGRNEHGEVGLAAGAGKGCGHVGLSSLGIFDAENEHVLRQPAFVARHGRGDAERKALFPKEGVAAVAASEAPDLARLREVNDVFLRIAGPGDVFLAFLERRAHGMQTGHHASVGLVDQAKHLFPDAGHDAHVHDRVGRVGELHPDLRHGRSHRPHAEGEHIHGAALHAALEELAQLRLHLIRVHPVVGRPGGLLGMAADVGALLDPRHVAGIGFRVVAARPLLLVEADKGSRLDQLLAEPVVFGLGAVHPVNLVGFAKGRHLGDPALKVNVLAERF